MKISGFLKVLSLGLLVPSFNVLGHGNDSSDPVDGLMVTRHFTGSWDQVDQEAQGLSLDVIEQADGSRKSVVFWFTYGADRKPTWYLGIGDLVDNRIEYRLRESTDVDFMQDAVPGNESVRVIGTMTIEFDSCNSGFVTYETDHEEVGSGSFNIERLTEVMNTHCSGGISDDMHADGMFGEQRLALMPARDGVTGDGHARYEDYPGHMEFEVEIEDVIDGTFHLYVGMQHRGDFEVLDGRGHLEFRSPAETGMTMMNFDPRGMLIEVHDAQGVVLSSFDSSFEEDDHGHHGDGEGHHGDDDHDYDCEFGIGMGHGMGHGMTDCVNDGDYIEIEIDLENTGVLIDAKGDAEWSMHTNRVEFSVEIEGIPVGSYPLKVGGTKVGVIEAFEMHDGDVYGHIRFRDPETHGREHLDFEPRDQLIEVLQAGNVILSVQFPDE